MEEMIQNPYDLFAENQETYEEAVKKSVSESQSFQRTKHFRIDSVGTYPVRILPLAPTKPVSYTHLTLPTKLEV